MTPRVTLFSPLLSAGDSLFKDMYDLLRVMQENEIPSYNLVWKCKPSYFEGVRKFFIDNGERVWWEPGTTPEMFLGHPVEATLPEDGNASCVLTVR